MSDKYNKVSIDLTMMSQNVSNLIELAQSVDLKIKKIKQSVKIIEQSFSGNDSQSLTNSVMYNLLAMENLLEVEKKAIGECSFALNMYKENEQKTKDIIDAIVFD